MTISLSNNSARVSYSVSAGASQTSFTVPFEFFDADDLTFYVDGTAKTLTTHYTVSGGSGSTGTISTTSGNAVTGISGGSTVVITRDIDLDRVTDFPSSGPFAVATLNTELDRFTAIAADQKDEADRALRLQDFDSAVAMTLPLKAARLGTVLGFNASTGAPEAGPTIANVNSLSAITTNINTVAGITSNVTTVAGISGNVTTVAGIASNVTSVAGNASNINAAVSNASNINTVAGNISNVNAVGAKSSLITSDFVSDLNTLAVTDVINDINTLATSDIVNDLNLLATSDIVSDLNTLATSDIISDINTLATADIVSDLNQLATSDFVSDLNTMATTTNVNNLGTVAGAVSNVNTVAGIASDVSAVSAISSDVAAVENIASNVTSVAGNASNINSAVSNASNINAAVSNASNINSVAGIAANVTTVAGIASNVTTVAGASSNVSTVAGAITNVNNVGGSIANVNTVATNISGVNSFAERYRVGSNDPSSSLDAGDLAYNTSDNALKYYTGSAWASITAGIGNIVEDTSPQLGGDLQSNGNDIVIADTDNIYVGTSNDGLKIHHSNNNSFIEDVGTGNFLITTNGNNIQLMKNQAEQMLVAKTDGSVELYYDNAKKFETTSSGVDVTGGFTATAASTITTTGNEVQLTLKSTDADAVEGPTLDLIRDSASPAASDNIGLIRYIGEDSAGNATVYAEIHGQIENPANGSEDAALNFEITKGSGRANSFKIAADEVVVNDASRDVDFRVESDNTTHALFVEGSSGNVGIGTASPEDFGGGYTTLEVAGSSTANGGIFKTATSDSAGTGTAGTEMLMYTNNGGGVIAVTSSDPLMFQTAGAERMRIDGSSVLIGKTSEAMATAGSQFRSSGQALDITRDGGSPLNVNRLSSSGELVGFFQDTAQFGQITCFTTGGTDYLQVGSSGSSKAGVVFETNRIYPTVAGSASDGTVDLGTSSVRFKDGYFGGSVYATRLKGTAGHTGEVHFTGSHDVRFVTNGNERGRFDSSGRFAVGKVPDSNFNIGCELDPSGFLIASRTSNTPAFFNRTDTGAIVWFGRNSANKGDISINSTGVTFNTTSDIRLKQDIEPLAATDKLMDMNPVSYAWKVDPDGPRSMGFIAQEMREIMPEAVSTGDDEDAMMSMDYGRITPILVSALQDAHRKIEQLEQRIAEMEAN